MNHEYADAKAIVFLYRSGNHRNKVVLYDDYLLVIYRGNKNAFRLEDVDKLFFTRHKILIPIVVGGIISSFSLIAIFVSFYSPLLVISLLITGLLVLYLGYNGEDVLVVDLKVKQEYYPLRKVTDNLKAFVRFVNNFLKAGKDKLRWYIFVTADTLHQVKEDEKYPVQAFTYEQMREQKLKFAQKNDKTFVALNPFQLKSEVRFEKSTSNNELYPMIYGAINQEAVVKNDEVE